MWTDHIGKLAQMSPKPATMADAVAAMESSLAIAVRLLESAEYMGKCADDGDCERCAWDSERDAFVKRWRHLR